MASANWVELGGIAQLVAAGGTLGLAAVTAWLAKRTHEMAKEAEGQVAAALREAKATETLAVEARTDRQLAWRPQLELTHYDHTQDNFQFDLRNTGPGPALQVSCMAREIENVSRWCILHTNDLRPGDSTRVGAPVWTAGGSVDSPFRDVPGLMDGVEDVQVVLMCADVLGRRFRFCFAKPRHLPSDDKFLKPLPPDIAVADDEQRYARWAAEPMVWG